MTTYGRNRQSIANIEEELNSIFDKHPKSQINANGDPVIPADNLLDILHSFSELYDGQPLLSDEETAMLQSLLAQNPGLEVTPQILLGFIAEKTKHSTPPRSPGPNDMFGNDAGDEYDFEEDNRGRDDDRSGGGYGHSRSLSSDSDGTSYYPGSRPPSRGPMTPAKSPLDSERRQRSQPLVAAPPSSWSKRPTPAGRRKSDAGRGSDSEGGTPSAWNRSTSRNRQRQSSNPTSPSTPHRDLTFSSGSPPDYHPSPSSRPGSRAGFGGRSNSMDMGYSSPDDANHTVKSRPMSRYGYNNFGDISNMSSDSIANEVNTLLMPRPSSSQTDSDEEDEIVAGLVPDRSTASSTVSMEIHERMEALQRNNEELGRKLMEAERTLQNKLMEHETELEETHMRLEELRSELSLSNREEKELRAKDSRNMAQIATLEAEMAKIQKALDSAKATYSSLQKQYQEQCIVSEKYRDDLRRRDETIRSLRENAALFEIENAKWQKEHDTYEERLVSMEAELELAMQAHTQLDEQKQENMLLKETIDRMRYEMDEMRSAVTAAANMQSGTNSAAGTISKSLGAELAGKMRWEEEDSDSREHDTEEEIGSEASTAVDEEDDTEGEEDEDVIQTIITKRKRKVPSRAHELSSTRHEFSELKEYSDSSTQYDPTLFAVNHAMQTEAERNPIMATFSIQTDPEPVRVPTPPPRLPTPPPPRHMSEMEIQTELIEEEPSRSSSPGIQDESMASSSSTIIPAPSTPKAAHRALDTDDPPAYDKVHEETERLLCRWHNGAKTQPADNSITGEPFEFAGVQGGVSEEAVEDWNALKRELGVKCDVIEKVISASEVTSASSSSKLGKGKAPKNVNRSASGRFYNIYNTYVYGDKSSALGLSTHILLWVGASALALMAVSPYITPHYAVVPGGATYYDRAAWHSFNAIGGGGEGFGVAVGGGAGGGWLRPGGGGPDSLWGFFARAGGGAAARIARGWPA
ncbi:hypothetical protein CPB83DRAFT_416318 [Crepidotus variabilis]|uniref:Uncharacterized protein n=1 Tax=Crepidotus variabilis TaxID=179855 RepID=A0A9P6ES46_9AGAR|nr:hypothetical protein CPB83DRAFT_416318 [Crepidotus variabilis]